MGNQKKAIASEKTPTRTLEEEIVEKSKDWYENLPKEYKEALEMLTEAQTGESIEKFLKNEAYAFILSEGLLEKFLDFRERLHRTKTQDAYYNLVMLAEQGGLWIDMG